MSASLDIVIVNWNAGVQLAECLQSIAGAGCGGFELRRVVVADNASEDGSADGLNFPQLPLTVLRNKKNLGFAAACNQGAKGSSADYLLFLNPDTRVYPQTLAASVEFMEAPENRGVGISTVQLVDEDGKVARCCSRFVTAGIFAAKALGMNRVLPRRFPDQFYLEWDHGATREVDQVMGAYFFLRRQVFAALGGFDERFFVYFEDMDLSFRARRQGWKSVHFAGARAYHKGRGTTEQVRARRLFYSLRSRLQYCLKHMEWAPKLTVFAVTLLLEPATRILFAAARGRWKEVAETLEAYAMLYWQGLFTSATKRPAAAERP